MRSLLAPAAKALSALVFTSFLAASAQASPTLIISGGILTGANGVVVDGNTYNVSFQDGSCVGLFGACAAASDFVFTTQASALLAANALLDQVFVDSALGNFDSVSALTQGCVGNKIGICNVETPYLLDGSDVLLGAAGNRDTLDFTSVNGLSVSGPNSDTTGNLSQVYAVWVRVPEVDAGTVPEPGSLALAGLALMALAASARRRG